MNTLGRLFYNHNPFYVISAGLVLHGLHQSVRAPQGIGVWTLLACLAGYTIMLALAAILIVRLCRVWEDARTIVLAVVLLLLTISVGFDDIVQDSLRTGGLLLGLGLGLSMLVSEALIQGLRLRLPVLFRLPYHGLLTLFFLYPLLVASVDPADRRLLALALLGFPAAAGLMLLTLLPAIRRGASYVSDNGTPWGWPLYPWSLFLLMLVGIGLRSYLFCVSFYPGHQSVDPFGLYFLWPVLLAGAVLMLEMSRVEDQPVLRWVAFGLPLLMLVLSFPGVFGQTTDARFLRKVVSVVGSPVWQAVLGMLAFYGVAWLRGWREAEVGMVFSLLVASRIGFDSTSPGDLLGWPGGLALGVIAALQLALLWRQPASWRALLVLVGITGTPELLLGSGWYLDFNHALPTNLLVGGMLVIGLFFNDRLAKRILRLGILGTAGLLVGALAVRQSLDLWVLTPYLLLLIGVPAVSYLLSWEPLYFRVLIFNGVLSTMHLGETTHRLARTNEHFQGLVPVFWGGVCLLLGVAISLDKGGSREGWPRPWGRLLERLRGSAAPDPPPRSLCPGTVDPGALSLGSAEDPPA